MATKRGKSQKRQQMPNHLSAPPIIFEKDENHRVTYANIVQVMHGPYDFQLTFGLVNSLDPRPGKATVTAMQTIILTPQHVKGLVETLQANIAKYEHRYMSIPEDIREKALEDMDDESDDEMDVEGGGNGAGV
jgi:hypothetical protein